MHLPFMQIATEVIEQSAPDLSVVLNWTEADAGWGLLKMFKWALGRVPDGELPSKHSVVKGPAAAQLVARAANWKGDPKAFVDACESLSPAPLLERVGNDGSIRVCGLKRYDTAVESAEERSKKAKAAADARWGKERDGSARAEHAPSSAQASSEHPSSNARTMLGDAKTQTQTQIETQKKKETETETQPAPAGPEAEATSPEEQQEADLCWEGFQANREKAGLKREKHRPKDFVDFVRRARREHEPEEIGRAHGLFLRSPDFRKGGWATAVFIVDSVWEIRAGVGDPPPERDPLTGVRRHA